jgi:hypothetical protein
MHSDWFNGIDILQGRWQHGEKVGYCYPSRLEKTLCTWELYVPLVTKGLTKYCHEERTKDANQSLPASDETRQRNTFVKYKKCDTFLKLDCVRSDTSFKPKYLLKVKHSRYKEICVLPHLQTDRPARPRKQHDCHHDTKVKPEAATAVIELLMMGGKTPETC